MPTQKNTPAKAKLTIAQLQEKFENQEEEIKRLRDLVLEKDLKIQSIERKVIRLEFDIIKLNSLQHIKTRVIDQLKSEVTNLQQYSRRPCAIISGINKNANEVASIKDIISKSNSGVTWGDVDKCHRIGNTNVEKNTQDVIVRFKDHSTKEKFYSKRKTLPKHLKVKPALCAARKSLLNEANDYINDEALKESLKNHPPSFVFADVHGSLKIALAAGTERNPDRKIFGNFSSMLELTQFILKNNTSDLDQNETSENVEGDQH